MSANSSPVEGKLPTRSNTMRTVSTGTERRASVSDDEAIPGSDSNEVCFAKSVPESASDCYALDNKPPRREAPGLEAHVWIFGGLCFCHCESAEGNVKGL